MKQLNAYADDAVSEVLTRLRVHSTVYCLAELRSPWGFRVEGRDVAKFHLLLEGDVWLAVDAHDPLLLSAGELVILPYGHKHALKDEPDSRVEALDRILLDHPLDARARLYYGGAGALSRMLCGGFGLNDPVRGLCRTSCVSTRSPAESDPGPKRLSSFSGQRPRSRYRAPRQSSPRSPTYFWHKRCASSSPALRRRVRPPL
jgi:mannose-6-phosphate isomerase-like protein (cupin superfamily)